MWPSEWIHSEMVSRRYRCEMVTVERRPMTTVALLERTQEFLNATVPGARDPNAQVHQLIEFESLRRLGRYRRTDLTLARKYEMSFAEFVARRIPRQKDYSWEVEQDAMDWETAIGGIATMERQLRQLRGGNGERAA